MPRFASRLVPPLFGKGYHHSPSLPPSLAKYRQEREIPTLSLERKKNSRETGDEKERKREREKKKGGGEEKREIPTKDR